MKGKSTPAPAKSERVEMAETLAAAETIFAETLAAAETIFAETLAAAAKDPTPAEIETEAKALVDALHAANLAWIQANHAELVNDLKPEPRAA
jgi:hypothetical protein